MLPSVRRGGHSAVLLFQEGTQLDSCTIDLAKHRPSTAAQHAARFFRREPIPRSQQQSFSLVLLQPGKRTLQFVVVVALEDRIFEC
jgi:hypothetical protein